MTALALGWLADALADEGEAPAGWSVQPLASVAVFVPDPIQAPPTRQLEVGAALSPGGAPFLRGRAGVALRSLGADLLAVAEAGVAGSGARGSARDAAIGLGVRQQFTAGDLYVVRDGGAVERATDLGTTLMLVTLEGGLGVDVGALRGPPLRALVAPRIQLTLPQRSQAALELGIGLRVGWSP